MFTTNDCKKLYERQLMVVYTVALANAGLEQKRRIGSKALQLAKLTRQDVAIPGGFVITAEALERFLSSSGLLAEGRIELAEKHIIEADIPEDVRQEVAAAYAPFAGTAVAVRSSSSAEDLEEASFAGQYETILNVTSLPHLLESLKRCWASLFSERVKEYALQKKIGLEAGDLPMGVLVQQMVQADVSGVIFSINPVTRSADEIVINASYGLGEAVVSGLVTPDMYVVRKSDGHVDKELGLKEMKIVAADLETVEVETTEEEQNRFCLTDGIIAELAEQARLIEAYFRMPVDIEFAVKDGRVHILQARPITA